MAQIIQFPTCESNSDNLKDMYDWNGSDWKNFIEQAIGTIAEQTGRDPYDVFAEVMHEIIFSE